MSQSTPDLSQLFGMALQAMTQNRERINELDGNNGNHGDNMVHNLSLITNTLRSEKSQPPSDALSHAASLLQAEGRGGTSQYYAQGLNQAAAQFKGQSSLSHNDVMSLVQAMLGSVPAQSAPPPPSQPAAGDVLGDLLGAVTGQSPQAAAPPARAGGTILEALMGMAGGQAAQAASPPSQSGEGDVLGGILGMVTGQSPQQTGQANSPGVDMGDLLNAGMAFMRAKQAGADNTAAVMQAATSALMGGDPLQAGSPRAAAGGLIGQTILQALAGRR